MLATVRALCLSTVLSALFAASDAFVQADGKPLPPGAPTAACEFNGAHDIVNYRVLAGTDPIPFVFRCGTDKPDVCSFSTLSLTGRFASNPMVGLSGKVSGAWSCVRADGESGWLPTARLGPLPETPAVTTAQWLGTWGGGKDEHGLPYSSIVLTRSKTGRGVVHAHGYGYHYNYFHVPTMGEFEADGVAHGPLLHIVDHSYYGSAEDAEDDCIVDLVYSPETDTVRAVDNELCGGMFVRFDGVWNRTLSSSGRAAHGRRTENSNKK